MLLRNYFICSDDKIIVFFIVSRSFPLKVIEILPNYTYCTNYLFIYFLQPQKPFSDYQGIFFNRNIFAMHVQHKFISDLFLPYPQNMRCLMKFRRTFDLLLLLMLHYMFCFKIKILYHSEFSRFFLTIFYKNMHIGEIDYVLQHSTDYR